MNLNSFKNLSPEVLGELYEMALVYVPGLAQVMHKACSPDPLLKEAFFKVGGLASPRVGAEAISFLFSQEGEEESLQEALYESLAVFFKKLPKNPVVETERMAKFRRHWKKEEVTAAIYKKLCDLYESSYEEEFEAAFDAAVRRFIEVYNK